MTVSSGSTREVTAAPIRPLVWVVFVASFLFGLGYGVSFLLPPLFRGFGANEADVGTVLGVAAVATLVAVLFAGHVADAIGRARAIALGGVLLAGAHVGLGHLIVRYGTTALVVVMTGLAGVECLMALARHLAIRRAPAPFAPPAQAER